MTVVSDKGKKFPPEVKLLHGLKAWTNVNQPEEWLITDPKGWQIYGLLTRQASGDLLFSPRWQVGFQWQGKDLTIYPEASRHSSPFEDGDEKAYLKQGKRLTHYTSRKKWRKTDVS